jgi:hypothetical protein
MGQAYGGQVMRQFSIALDVFIVAAFVAAGYLAPNQFLSGIFYGVAGAWAVFRVSAGLHEAYIIWREKTDAKAFEAGYLRGHQSALKQITNQTGVDKVVG